MALDLDHARRRLDEEDARVTRLRDELEGQLADEQAGDAAELSSLDQHPAESATDTVDEERDLSLLEQLNAEIEELNAARERLEAGTYGRCEVCGTELPAERIDALPAARRCAEHQALAESTVKSLP